MQFTLNITLRAAIVFICDDICAKLIVIGFPHVGSQKGEGFLKWRTPHFPSGRWIFCRETVVLTRCSTERNYAVWIHKCDLTALTTDVNCVVFWVCHCPCVRLNAQSQLQERKMRETWGKFWFMFVTLFSHLLESWSGIGCREIYCLLWVLCDLWVTS